MAWEFRQREKGNCDECGKNKVLYWIEGEGFHSITLCKKCWKELFLLINRVVKLGY